MAIDFPRTIDQVTPAWLSDILGAAVADYQVTFLEGGNLSDAFKVHRITYDPPVPSAPASLVLKFPHSVKASRDNAVRRSSTRCSWTTAQRPTIS
jgi:hypothetical protein